MRNFAKTSTALLVTGATAAFAAGSDGGYASANAYVRLGFDNMLKPTKDAQYGFALNADQRYSPIKRGAPTAEMLFDRRGFLTAWLNGLPIAQSVTLQQDEGGGGGESNFTKIDWAMVAAGAAGVGYLVYEVVNQSDTRDAPGAGGSGTPSGTPAACPAGTSGSPPACVPNPLPSCPAGQIGTPPACVPAACPAGTTGVPPACRPIPVPGFTSGQLWRDDAILRESTSWLDEGTGQMGDLVFIKK